MRSFDLSPLFRSTVGFDRLADMLDSVSQYDSSVQTYPPITSSGPTRTTTGSRWRSPVSAKAT